MNSLGNDIFKNKAKDGAKGHYKTKIEQSFLNLVTEIGPDDYHSLVPVVTINLKVSSTSLHEDVGTLKSSLP